MGKQWKEWETLYLGGSKITAHGDCSHEMKRCLLLGRKAMINLGSILKIRDITLPTKVHPVKAMVFLVVMYGCQNWTIKKAEHWRIDAFELWCWRKLLRVPWTARRSDQSILKDISPEYSLEGLMLKLKLQSWCEELTHLKRHWCWERLKVGGEGDDRGWDSWMASLTWWTWVWASSGSWWWTGEPGMLQFMGSQKVIHDWATELNWYGFFFWTQFYSGGLCLPLRQNHTVLITAALQETKCKVCLSVLFFFFEIVLAVGPPCSSIWTEGLIFH